MISIKNEPIQITQSIGSTITLESFKTLLDMLPIGFHILYTTRQGAKALGIAPKATDAFCHFYVLKRTNDYIFCEAVPWMYRYGTYVLIKNVEWGDDFHRRESGGG